MSRVATISKSPPLRPGSRAAFSIHPITRSQLPVTAPRSDRRPEPEPAGTPVPPDPPTAATPTRSQTARDRTGQNHSLQAAPREPERPATPIELPHQHDESHP